MGSAGRRSCPFRCRSSVVSRSKSPSPLSFLARFPSVRADVLWSCLCGAAALAACSLAADDYTPVRVDTRPNLAESGDASAPVSCPGAAQCCEEKPCDAEQSCRDGLCESSSAPDAGLCTGEGCSG